MDAPLGNPNQISYEQGADLSSPNLANLIQLADFAVAFKARWIKGEDRRGNARRLLTSFPD